IYRNEIYKNKIKKLRIKGYAGYIMDKKSIFLKRLTESGNSFVSGASLAHELGISRSAIWKYAESLKADGYVIESVVSKGYRLISCDCLSAEVISAKCETSHIGKNAIVFDEVVSTNITAKELAVKGAPHGTVVVSEFQTGGKGRLGRKFESPAGSGLYMSVLIRPDFKLTYAPFITSAAAVASAEAVENLCGKDVQIKWVNDLYMNGRKICGILTEAVLGLEINTLDYAVIGIGINVRHTDFDPELRKKASSVEDESGIIMDRNELCSAVCGRLEYYLDNLERKIHLDEYRRREMLTGQVITAETGNQRYTGKALGIDENANLTVQLDDGTIKSLSSGEAHIVQDII
ncbi:MAG: biotin--[acetyl-CoA-carboxylase] ligase, partial [Ruminococcus sp.]|nr:biotin--[acetyl-CoA-carboxylase] ligase [Ruminococcus sp.]